MEQGKTAKSIIDQADRTGMELPEKLQNAPEVELGLGIFYDAFWDLDTCRFELGPIPWTAIFTYCEQYEIYGEQREDMFFYVMEMDKAYLDFKSKQIKRDIGNGKS